MTKRNSIVIGMALVALLVAGGLFASNMGFKLNYVLEATGTNGSNSGTNTLALPFNQQTSLITASDLLADIEASGGPTSVATVSRLQSDLDALEIYNGVQPAGNFTLTAGQGYQVQVNNDVNYIVVGSHDPGLVVNLDATGTNGSASGTTLFSLPYHTTVTTTAELFDELVTAGGAGSVATVSVLNRTSDTLTIYNGVQPGGVVPVAPGRAYTIQVNSDIAYVPSHY